MDLRASVWSCWTHLGHLVSFLDDVDRSGIHFGRFVIHFAFNLGVLLEILKVKSANLDVKLGAKDGTQTQ